MCEVSIPRAAARVGASLAVGGGGPACPRSVSRVVGGAPPDIRTTSLIGRAAELSFGREALTNGVGLVITGAAGVGKTRFAGELVAQVFGTTRRTQRIVATRAAATIPLGALGALVPAETTPDVLTVNALAASLRTDDEAPLVLLIDDAHLLDETSAVLVQQLVIEHSAVAVMTVRSRAPTSDAIVSLWKDEYCRRLELQSLSGDETAELVGQLLPGIVDEAVVQRCWSLTLGNPMFVRELVRGAIESDALHRRHGAWTWPGRFEPGSALVDLVADRLAGLLEPERELLALVALGEPVSVEVASALRGGETLETLARAAVVDVDEHQRVRLAHPLYGELVRQELVVPTVARLCGELALAHPLPLADPSAELRRIVWHVEAGIALDPKVLLEASLRAQVHDLELAARLARAAVDAGGGTEASLRLVDVLTNGGRLDEADALLASLASTELDDRSRVTIAAIRATSLLWLRGRPADARAILDEAEASVRDRVLTQELTSLRLHALLLEGRVVDIDGVVREVLATEELSFETKAGALIAGVPAWLTTADLEVAITRCEAGLEIAARSSDAFPVQDLLRYGIEVARLYLGELDRAEDELRRLRQESARAKDSLLRFLFSQGIGRVEMLRGRYSAAAAAFQEAVALIQMSPDLIAWNLGLLATAQVLAGDVERGEQTLRDANERTTSKMFVADRERCAALLANARGERGHAAAASLEAGDRALALGQRLGACFCFYDAARFGSAHAALDRFDELDGFPGVLFTAIRAHVAALVADRGEDLEAASHQLEQVGCDRWAADAGADAARAFADEGLASRATRAAERTRQIASRVDAVVADLDVLRSIAALTPRERDIATMAARGMTDREIGETLGISVRTVETHLHRVYGKLGVASRAELATYVSDH